VSSLSQAGAGRSERPRGIAGWLARGAFFAGAIGLLLAMAFDAAAVVGRHAGLPFLGSIELVQACVVVVASSALVGATLGRSHASVHILSERLAPAPRARLRRVSDGLSALFFAALAAGSWWIAADMWAGSETTELLGLPIKPLRVFFLASSILIASSFLGSAFARRSEEA
jgi:TRAP-type C4-dicarboxylate transport system permease small subunit